MTETSQKKLTPLTQEQVKELKIKERIWRVQHEVKTLIKDELNKFQNYSYFDENQILKILKPLLEWYRLLIEIRDDDNKEFIHEKETVSEKRIIHYIKYLKVLTVSNLDNDEERIFKFWACGSNDDLAKAKGSAETYAMKYILSKFFLIRVLDNNDPELLEPIEKTKKDLKDLSKEEQAQIKEIMERHNIKGLTTTFSKK